MKTSSTLALRLDDVFKKRIEEAARLSGMSLSEFIRLAASRFAAETYDHYGLEVPDLSGWHMVKGGDTSEARARKDKNYRKRTVADKVSAASRLIEEKGERDGRKGRGEVEHKGSGEAA